MDVDGDGVDDYIVVGVDDGAVRTGSFSGKYGVFVFSTRSGGASAAFLPTAPTDSSIVELPILSSQLCRAGEPCLSAANPRFTYHAIGFDNLNGGSDPVGGVGSFQCLVQRDQRRLRHGGAGGADTSNTIAINSAELALTPALGVMVVTLDNKGGADQAQLIKVK